ncbi:YbaB/EbfC DNA-binding family protein [Actinokineospora alba]|uniref:YbaB/EbfC DNA-binding family protein n=1 Tax=Actinokineospora alba TaxID=504798 RepID=A0A1H0JPF2_9PSEU|nr:YbaB/EbfC family nucleoid-associated protein [Actinokineospora alba]TDP68227.1 YbaB/EbfC DNA-binding family protein [Actinokineospora alba]SDH94676.1 YbaB/EbfC DNA-binding family protein [Actinokineospora alba]SDO45241.1 YbaB/EbfC DNA-binding family protein [Actinokineospora alba]
MQTPDEWLADFERKVADLQQKATEFKTNVEAAGATERSESVTVTVAASGALLDLKLEDSALRKSASELASEILTLTRQARQSAAVGVAQAFQPLGGDAGVVQRIPVPEPVEADSPAPKGSVARDDDDFGDETVVLRDADKW